MKNGLSKYIPIADAIAMLLHPYAEVVIHDILKDIIVHIANPYSKRKVGDSSYLGLNHKYSILVRLRLCHMAQI